MAEHHVARCEHDIRHVRKELQRWSRNMLIFLGVEEIAESLVGPERWTWLKATYDRCQSDLPSCDWTPSEEPPSCHNCAGSTRHAAFLYGTGDSQQQQQNSQLSEQECKMEREQEVIKAEDHDRGEESAAALKSLVERSESPPSISAAAVAIIAAHIGNLDKRDTGIKNEPNVDIDIDVDVEGDERGGGGEEERKPNGPPGLVRKDSQSKPSLRPFLEGNDYEEADEEEEEEDDDDDDDEDDFIRESEDDREDDEGEEVSDQPLDLSVKSNSPFSSASASPNPASEQSVEGVINLVKEKSGDAKEVDVCAVGGRDDFSVKKMNGRPDAIASPILFNNNNNNNGGSSPAAGLNSVQRRTYSDADLQAALKEIRSGQLGTRKASVIYGVPRSTLRNKVYKLQAHDKRLLASGTSSSSSSSHVKLNSRSPQQMDGDVDVESVERMRKIGSPVMDWYDGSSQVVMMGRSRGTHDAVGRLSALPFPPFSTPLESRSIPDENHFSPADRRRQMSGATSSAESCPSPAGSSVEVSLKDVIARTVATRLAKATSMVTNADKPPSNRDPQPSAAPPTPSSNRNSRPKRGKYRNYDQQNLLQAVKAVQMGEMSVHRAGTFYGVPHSTLEYKVKERHLMRPRKRPRKDENASAPVGPPITPINGTKFVSKTPVASQGLPDDSSSSSESEASPEKRRPSTPEHVANGNLFPFSQQQQKVAALSNGLPSFLPGTFPAPYGLPPPPPYLFWNARTSLPPPQLLGLPPHGPPFTRWLSPTMPGGLDLGFKQRSGLTFEEAKQQWLGKLEPVDPEEGKTAEDGRKDKGSYKDDLRAAIVAMQTAEDEDT